MMRRSRYALGAVGVLGAVLAALAACSGESPATLCGAGTRLVGSTCVAAGSEAGTPDGGPDVQTQDDGGPEAGQEEDAGLDDPCPPNLSGTGTSEEGDGGLRTATLNCDPKCGAVAELCEPIRCRKVGEKRPFPSSLYESVTAIGVGYAPRWVIRLPRDPWTVYGECNPSTTVTGEAPYVAQSPQPRFAIAIRLSDAGTFQGTDVFFAAQVGPYTARQFVYGRRLGNSWGDNRFEPFPVAGAYGSFEKDHEGCGLLNANEPFASIGASPALVMIAVHTKAAHVRATNLLFDFSPSAKCGGTP